MHNILVDHQHGFRWNCSCETQLINTLEHLARSVNSRHQTDLLILGFSKAFDSVAHRRLLLKLDYYGIRRQILDWLQSWLVNRAQQVVLEGHHSIKSKILLGVSQGTVLAPLFPALRKWYGQQHIITAKTICLWHSPVCSNTQPRWYTQGWRQRLQPPVGES